MSDSTKTYIDSVYLLLLSLLAMDTGTYDAYENISNLLLLICYLYVGELLAMNT